jgi:hypothetical protein
MSVDDSNYLYRLINDRVKNYQRSGKDRRQHQGEPPGEEQRQGSERRQPEPELQARPSSPQHQQQWRGQYTERNPFTELLNTCCATVHNQGLRVDVIVRIHPKKP